MLHSSAWSGKNLNGAGATSDEANRLKTELQATHEPNKAFHRNALQFLVVSVTFEHTVALQVDVVACDFHPDYQNTRNSCLLIVDLLISIAHEPLELA